MPAIEKPIFEDHCRDVVLELRGALINLYRDVGSDPTCPQEVSRRFKLNKNLTWKLARIIQANDAFEAVPLIPGVGGLVIFFDTMAEAGASASLVQRAHEALRMYEQMIELHAGDRGALDLMLDSMGGSDQRLLKSRKLAYQGNTGLWGLQAKTRITAQFLAPNDTDPTMLDAVQIAGLERVRRLRPVPRWKVFRIGRYLDREAPSDRFALDEGETGTPGLMRSFCRGEMPQIYISEQNDGVFYELGEGPIGRTGEFSCYFGYAHRKFVTRYAQSHGRGSLYAAVSMPVENVIFDMFVHRDMPEALRMESAIYGKPWSDSGEVDPSARLPIHESVIDLGRGANVSTPLAGDYSGAVDLAFARMGWNPNDFHCLRLVVEYPPMPSTVAMSFDLPSAP